MQKDALSNSILVFGLIILNAFFVAAEYALLTLRKTKVDQYVRQRVLGFAMIRRALDNLYAVISATQLGSTLCSILIGWFGEPLIENMLVPLIKMIPYKVAPIVVQSISVVITIGLLSFLQMIFGEIIPKTIALQKSELVSRLLIIPLNFFTFLFSPFILITNAVSNSFLKLLKLRPGQKEQIDYSQEEIKVILTESMKSRTLPPHQAHLLTNILSLQRTSLSKLMIEKNKLFSVSHNETLDEIKKRIADNKHSYNRYPVFFTKNLIVGYIHLSDILRFSENGKSHMRLSDTNLIRDILHITDQYPPDKLLIQMREKGIHVAAVKSHDQELLGVVTLTDIIEFLVNHR